MLLTRGAVDRLSTLCVLVMKLREKYMPTSLIQLMNPLGSVWAHGSHSASPRQAAIEELYKQPRDQAIATIIDYVLMPNVPM
jgi:hypothetical protein